MLGRPALKMQGILKKIPLFKSVICPEYTPCNQKQKQSILLERILLKEIWVVIKHVTFLLNEIKLAFCQALINSENPQRHKLSHSMAL